MAFTRDHGTFCCMLPLKLGVGLAAFLVFAHGLMGMLAVLTGDVRFQPNGYNKFVDRIPSTFNILGMVYGFVGLLGVYDDLFTWLWHFNRYFFLKIVIMAIAMIADFVTLHNCESWMYTFNHETNPRLDWISHAKVCSWARWSYLVGCIIDLSFWCFLFQRCFHYEWQIWACPPYPIDFGFEQDAKKRWGMYHVSGVSPRVPPVSEEDPPTFHGYGSVPAEPVRVSELATKSPTLRVHLPGGIEHETYGPDGMKV